MEEVIFTLTDQFGNEAWQGRPRGGYWLPREFHAWPEIRAARIGAVGLFVYHGIWAASTNHHTLDRRIAKRYGSAEWIAQLVELNLWTETTSGDYTTKTMADLRAGRGRPGLIMLLSRLLHGAPELYRAGMPAFGVWVRSASWSLSTCTPGYIPTEIARSFGKAKHAAELWDRGLWTASEHGFRMHQGTHPIERRWALARDDTRAEIPPELRQRILTRDGFACVECGGAEDLTLDHIVPWSHGGPDTFDNLRTLCRPCNSSKGARIE